MNTYTSQKEDLEHQQSHGNHCGLETLINAKLIVQFCRGFNLEQLREFVAYPQDIAIKLFEQKCLCDLMPLIFLLHRE